MHYEHLGNYINRKLIIGIFLNSIFVIVELVAGILIGSLALVSDAGHNFSDSLALILSLFALYISSRPATPQKTFGYHRVGILTALVNALVLVLISGAIIFEAYDRLLNPIAISGIWIFVVAGIGFVINSMVAYGFRSHQHDLNIKSAFLHLLTDALVSLGVVIAGIVIMFTGITIIDPLVSIVISLIILYMAWDIIKESVDILLEAVPRKINLDEVVGSLKQIKGIKDIHDTHIWTIGSNVFALSCHALIEDVSIYESSRLLKQMEEILKHKFNIVHPTVQFECEECEPAKICTIPQRKLK
jgi:cobalt-zinc-cadmium efflux system protein